MPLSPGDLLVDGNLVDAAFEITTNETDAAYITRGGKLVEWLSQKGDVSSFLASGKPADSTGNDGDQHVVPYGTDLVGLTFERRQGTWVQVAQSFTPFLETLPNAASITNIASNLSTGNKYWLYLFNQADQVDNGFYTINTSGILAGPYTDGGGASSTVQNLGDLLDVDDSDTTVGYVLRRNASGTFEMTPSGGILTQAGWDPASFTNIVNTKVLDADNVTLQELADIVGTLIGDLVSATVLEP